jgi:uncharacterized membrane protein YgaE (UPF0421/DUF939 family)
MDPAPPTHASDAGASPLRARWGRWMQALTGRRRWQGRPLSELLAIDRGVLVQALKIAVSAGVSWALAQWWLSSPSPIWAPITAALISSLTVWASIRDAAEKIIGVVVGIAVAIWLGGLIGLHAWSIALIVAVGFLAGRVLRLSGSAAAQIPINGLFILALGGGGERFLDTLIGAGVAIVVNVAIVPPNHVSAATRSVAGLADGVVDTLTTVATGIAAPWRLDAASTWLRAAREQSRFALAAESATERAGQSLEMHPGRSSWRNSLDRLQQTNDTLQIVEVQVRTLARTVRDIATKIPRADGTQPPMPMASAMLTATAWAIEAFAHTMLRAEKDAAAEVTGGAARRCIQQARAKIAEINEDLADMLSANLTRGVFLGALVVETGRILDELESGLAAMTSASDTGEFPASTIGD